MLWTLFGVHACAIGDIYIIMIICEQVYYWTRLCVIFRSLKNKRINDRIITWSYRKSFQRFVVNFLWCTWLCYSEWLPLFLSLGRGPFCGLLLFIYIYSVSLTNNRVTQNNTGMYTNETSQTFKIPNNNSGVVVQSNSYALKCIKKRD